MTTKMHAQKIAGAMLLLASIFTLLNVGNERLQAAPTSSAPTSSAPTSAAQPAASQTSTASSHQLAPAQGVVMHFMDRTMGQLFNMPLIWDFNGEMPKGEFYSLTKGLVKINPGVRLYFQPNGLALEHPGILQDFPPESLHGLDVMNLEFEDQFLSHVGKVHSLRALKLKGTDIDDNKMKYLDNLPNLKNIDLSKTLVEGPGLSKLKASKDLRRIDISWDPLRPEIGQNLSNFPNLTCLFLAHARIKDSYLPSIAKLKTLTHLKLSENNDITDSGIAALAPLKSLKVLEVVDTKITPAGLTQLKTIPLKIIWVDKRHENATNKALLHKAFPACTFRFERSQIGNAPVELFEPLH